MKYALTAAAGLALSAGASADVAFSAAGPFTLAGGASAVLFSGNASGTLTGFDWSFDWATPGDSSWASDMQITITDPNANSATIEGYDLPGILTSYNGPASGPAGNYGDNIPLAGLSGSGVWTVTVSNDWGGDPNPNTISNFNGNLQGLVPTPGALGLFGIAGLAATRRRR